MKPKIRPIRIEGNIAYVQLTQGYEAIIDAEDVPLVAGYNWNAKPDGNTVYACRTDRSGPQQATVRLHRFLMGDPVGLEIDHIDGNGLNNRRLGDTGNLRVATAQQNKHNQRRNRRNSSGFKGVSWRKDCSKWAAQIRVAGKRRGLGHFESVEAAAAAYAEASARLHGHFGRAS